MPQDHAAGRFGDRVEWGWRVVDQADVVIVGAGMVGLCTAFELASMGVRRVTVLERGWAGSGSTSKATGGIRTQFSTLVNVRLAQASRERFVHWSEIYGGDPRFFPIGYLFVAVSDAMADQLVDGARRQRAWGVGVEILTPREIARWSPALRVDDVRVGTYTPEDGIADPGAAVNSLAASCRRRGVVLREGETVTRLAFDGEGAATGVELATGRGLRADAVVIAAGVWSAPLLEPIGFPLPVEPHHRQVYRTGAVPDWPSGVPLTVDLDTGLYCHGDGSAVVFGGGDRESAPTYDETPRPGDVSLLVERLVHRWPALDQAELRQTWAGLREMTPDDHGVVGPVPGHAGLYVAAGFSGHGFMQAPAVGELVAAMVCGRPTPLDATALDPGRFSGPLEGERYVF